MPNKIINKHYVKFSLQVSTENLLDSFLKLQSFFKDLQYENLEAYNASSKYLSLTKFDILLLVYKC